MRETTGHEEWKTAMPAQELLDQGKREMAKASEMAKKRPGPLGSPPQRGPANLGQDPPLRLNSIDYALTKSKRCGKTFKVGDEKSRPRDRPLLSWWAW